MHRMEVKYMQFSILTSDSMDYFSFFLSNQSSVMDKDGHPKSPLINVKSPPQNMCFIFRPMDGPFLSLVDDQYGHLFQLMSCGVVAV